jgi:hypothetical protein
MVSRNGCNAFAHLGNILVSLLELAGKIGALVVQHSCVTVFGVGHEHGPSGHLQQRLAFRGLDRDVGRWSGPDENLRNINLGRHRLAGAVHSNRDDQAGGAVDISFFALLMRPAIGRGRGHKTIAKRCKGPRLC